jgi:putative transposase
VPHGFAKPAFGGANHGFFCSRVQSRTMSRGLKRIYGGGDFHFVTCSCHEPRPFLRFAHRRDIVLQILEEVRQKYRFIIAGYVVMPEHFHLLIGEPDSCTPSSIMRALKQRVARRLLPELRSNGSREFAMKLWEPRFHDFNVYSKQKHVEKLRYIHRNPVRRGLVDKPEDWEWSSYRFYSKGISGPVKLNE